MAKRLITIIASLTVAIIVFYIWDNQRPETIASSNSGCFRLFSLSTPSKDHCVDYLFSQGREWEGFGYKIYYLDNFSEDELASITDDLIAHGASRSDSVITLTAQRGNIVGP